VKTELNSPADTSGFAKLIAIRHSFFTLLWMFECIVTSKSQNPNVNPSFWYYPEFQVLYTSHLEWWNPQPKNQPQKI